MWAEIITAVLVPIVLAIIGAVGWLGKWTRDEMLECKKDRADFHVTLIKVMSDCSDDRDVFHEKIAVLREELARTNEHLEHTDAKQVQNTKAIVEIKG